MIHPERGYFNDLAADLEVLEIQDGNLREPTNHEELYRLVRGISKNLHRDSNAYRVDPNDLKTDAGRRLLDLSGLVCNPKIQSCSTAEILFLNTFKPDNMTKTDKKRSPVVFTNEKSEPVAFLKDVGAATAYVLRDEPEYDLVEGCIYDLHFGEIPPPKADGIWQLSMDEVHVATPVRLTTFIIPPGKKSVLLSNTPNEDERRALQGSHESIVEMADEAVRRYNSHK